MLEKRWDMFDRKRLVSSLSLLSALTLLALVPSALARFSGPTSVSSRADCPPSPSLLPPGPRPIHLSAATATEVVERMKAIPFENGEEEGAVALVEAEVCLWVVPSSHEATERPLTVPLSVLSHYPLRC